jgi:hypothetical protein
MLHFLSRKVARELERLVQMCLHCDIETKAIKLI